MVYGLYADRNASVSAWYADPFEVLLSQIFKDDLIRPIFLPFYLPVKGTLLPYICFFFRGTLYLLLTLDDVAKPNTSRLRVCSDPVQLHKTPQILLAAQLGGLWLVRRRLGRLDAAPWSFGDKLFL